MAEVNVRPARREDLDAVARLWESLVEYHRQLDTDLPPAAPQGARRYARQLLDRLDDPMTRVLVADADGEIVGYVLGVVVDLAPAMFQQEASGFLADIFVDQAYRRQGVGRALVESLVAWFGAARLALLRVARRGAQSGEYRFLAQPRRARSHAADAQRN